MNVMRINVLQEMYENYEGWMQIFTDGSLSGDKRGVGIYDPNWNLDESGSNCYQIKGEICIMSLELTAILEAIKYVIFRGYNKAVICSDSKSALQHLISCTRGHIGFSIAYQILAEIIKLKQLNIKLKLQWVPSHIGLAGNEEADRCAKKGGKEGREIEVKPNYSEILNKYKTGIYNLWKEYFNERSKEKGIWYRTLQCQPPPIPWFLNVNVSRHKIVIAHRLRSGHMPLNKFAFLMKKIDSPNCEACGKIEDVHHLLMECDRNSRSRERLIRDLKLNRLDVGMFHDIMSRPDSDQAIKIYSFVWEYDQSRPAPA